MINIWLKNDISNGLFCIIAIMLSYRNTTTALFVTVTFCLNNVYCRIMSYCGLVTVRISEEIADSMQQ